MRPSVIVIMADDMGYGDFACVNNGLNKTPHLNALHASALRLSQAYAASPVCAPSRAGFLTGRYPFRTGCTDLNAINALNSLAPSEVTIAEFFKAAGYTTGLVGKWHCGMNKGSRPEDKGFSHIEAFHAEGQDYWNWTIDRNGREIEAEGRYLTDYLSDRAVDFIENHAEGPFFLHLAYYSPHRPLQAPSELVSKYAADKRLTPGQAVVYAMIEAMDTGIGRVVQALKDAGVYEDTIIVFTSDNGPDDFEENGLSPVRFNCGLRGQKYTVSEGGIRVPMLMNWPGKLAPGDNDTLFHFVDILPTLAAACDVPLQAGLPRDGVNRLDCLLGGTGADAVTRYWQWNRYYPQAECNAAIRQGKWKLVVPGREGYRKMSPENSAMVRREIPYRIIRPDQVPNPTLGPMQPPQLFDMEADPGETADLSHVKAELATALHNELGVWFDEMCAELDLIVKARFDKE